jgi:hypothetical protein
MKVELLGTSFTLQSDEKPEYLESVVGVFESKVEEIRGSVDTRDPVKLAILAGILLADELLKTADPPAGDGGGSEETSSPALSFSVDELDEAERITLELIDKIDTTLEEAAIRKAPEYD